MSNRDLDSNLKRMLNPMTPEQEDQILERAIARLSETQRTKDASQVTAEATPHTQKPFHHRPFSIGLAAAAILAATATGVFAVQALNPEPISPQLKSVQPGAGPVEVGKTRGGGRLSVEIAPDDHSYCMSFDAPDDLSSSSACDNGFDKSGVTAGVSCSKDSREASPTVTVRGLLTDDVTDLTVDTNAGRRPVTIDGNSFVYQSSNASTDPIRMHAIRSGKTLPVRLPLFDCRNT